MAGFDNGVVVAKNVNFSNVKPYTGEVVADGQLLIGSTAAPNIRVNTLSAGPGIVITNGAGAITIGAVSPVNFAWSTKTSGTNPNAISVFSGYISQGGSLVTFTLPATANVGDMFMITALGAEFKIEQNAGQSIVLGNHTTTVGVTGYLQSTTVSDHVTILCTIANTNFKVIGSMGNITVV